MNQNERDKLIVIGTDVEWIKDNMVTKAEWRPVRSIVYGAVGLILVMFMTAVAGLVFIQISR